VQLGVMLVLDCVDVDVGVAVGAEPPAVAGGALGFPRSVQNHLR